MLLADRAQAHLLTQHSGIVQIYNVEPGRAHRSYLLRDELDVRGEAEQRNVVRAPVEPRLVAVQAALRRADTLDLVAVRPRAHRALVLGGQAQEYTAIAELSLSKQVFDNQSNACMYVLAWCPRGFHSILYSSSPWTRPPHRSSGALSCFLIN